MFGFRNWSNHSFSGSISTDKGQSADIEMDGSGYIHGGRKVWRFRYTSEENTKSDIRQDETLNLTLGHRSRRARIASNPDESNYGFIELL